VDLRVFRHSWVRRCEHRLLIAVLVLLVIVLLQHAVEWCLRMRDSLNGANGEWTGKDDVSSYSTLMYLTVGADNTNEWRRVYRAEQVDSVPEGDLVEFVFSMRTHGYELAKLYMERFAQTRVGKNDLIGIERAMRRQIEIGDYGGIKRWPRVSSHPRARAMRGDNHLELGFHCGHAGHLMCVSPSSEGVPLGIPRPGTLMPRPLEPPAQVEVESSPQVRSSSVRRPDTPRPTINGNNGSATNTDDHLGWSCRVFPLTTWGYADPRWYVTRVNPDALDEDGQYAPGDTLSIRSHAPGTTMPDGPPIPVTKENLESFAKQADSALVSTSVIFMTVLYCAATNKRWATLALLPVLWMSNTLWRTSRNAYCVMRQAMWTSIGVIPVKESQGWKFVREQLSLRFRKQLNGNNGEATNSDDVPSTACRLVKSRLLNTKGSGDPNDWVPFSSRETITTIPTGHLAEVAFYVGPNGTSFVLRTEQPLAFDQRELEFAVPMLEALVWPQDKVRRGRLCQDPRVRAMYDAPIVRQMVTPLPGDHRVPHSAWSAALNSRSAFEPSEHDPDIQSDLNGSHGEFTNSDDVTLVGLDESLRAMEALNVAGHTEWQAPRRVDPPSQSNAISAGAAAESIRVSHTRMLQTNQHKRFQTHSPPSRQVTPPAAGWASVAKAGSVKSSGSQRSHRGKRGGQKHKRAKSDPGLGGRGQSPTPPAPLTAENLAKLSTPPTPSQNVPDKAGSIVSAGAAAARANLVPMTLYEEGVGFRDILEGRAKLTWPLDGRESFLASLWGRHTAYTYMVNPENVRKVWLQVCSRNVHEGTVGPIRGECAEKGLEDEELEVIPKLLFQRLEFQRAGDARAGASKTSIEHGRLNLCAPVWTILDLVRSLTYAATLKSTLSLMSCLSHSTTLPRSTPKPGSLMPAYSRSENVSRAVATARFLVPTFTILVSCLLARDTIRSCASLGSSMRRSMFTVFTRFKWGLLRRHL